MTKRFALLLGAAAAVPAPASAAILVQLSGSVYHASGDAIPRFAMGTRATAWFIYDENSTGRAWYPGGVLEPEVWFYQNAPMAGQLTVGDYSLTFGTSARMFVTNGEKKSSGGIMDRLLFDDHNPLGEDLNGRAVDAAGISWQDDSATALNDLKLPTSPSVFAALGRPTASIDWTPYIGAAHRVTVAFDQVNVSAVPEPSSWLMLIGGFGVVGTSLRRRRMKEVNFA